MVRSMVIAVQRGNAFNILTAGRESFRGVGGVKLYPFPHFVSVGISSSMRDFVFFVLILKF